jgi:hypothetical protein
MESQYNVPHDGYILFHCNWAEKPVKQHLNNKVIDPVKSGKTMSDSEANGKVMVQN